MAGTLTISTLSDGTNSTSTTNCIKGSAKAWILYNGSAQTVLGSFNISSVTYVGVGQYTLNFTTAMANANYSAVGIGCGTAALNGWIQQGFAFTYTTTACQIIQVSTSGAFDSIRVNVAIFGA